VKNVFRKNMAKIIFEIAFIFPSAFLTHHGVKYLVLARGIIYSGPFRIRIPSFKNKPTNKLTLFFMM
jgi:hypothetical protein